MSNPITTVLSVAACKAARSGLRIMHRGGTALPGKAAMVFDKKILEVTSRGVQVIVVTGTNGKTTTCRMLEHALTSSGYSALANKSGANLLSGVTAEFTADSAWNGRARKKYAVIECDEAALKQVVPLVHPKVLAVTNLFRDQLDRYGEVMHTQEEIRRGIRLVPEAILCLNADDSLVADLARDVPNPVVFYGFNTPVGEQKEVEISDATRCIRCGTKYRYTYHTYAHLGGFYCPKCGWKRPDVQVAVTAVNSVSADGSNVRMKFIDGAEENVQIALPAIYNAYNALAAVAAYQAAGHRREEILQSLATVHSSFGRMETFDLDGTRVQMILVKNPAGCNQALAYLHSLDEDYAAVFALNDRTADGHDISWIWDADYEQVCSDSHLKKIFVTGDRAEDLKVRMKYAGADAGAIEIRRDTNELFRRMKQCGLPVFVLPNYTSMLSLRAALSEATGRQEFWKG